MDWKLATERQQAALKRIVELLLALADLAERAGSRSRPVRGFVLWILLPAEAVARNLVTGAPAPIPLRRGGNSPTDAMRLARTLRDLARRLHCQAALVFAACDDGGWQTEPARFGMPRTLRSGGVLDVVNAPAFLACARDALRLADLPDTS